MKFSIVVPVSNGGQAFVRCLEAVAKARAGCQDLAECELIVVDDGSQDASPARAQTAGARVMFMPPPGGHGPASARNQGAGAATGDVLFFVDADVAVHPDAVRLAAQAFQSEPGLQACFGSYDSSPLASNFLSQYKNLLHHFIHQNANTAAATFWTGCGAVRTSAFLAVGGFDALTYRRPSIEDIDLGYRMRRRGADIRLIKDMQCQHLKPWSAASLLRSDVFERGIPWTVLLWRETRAARQPEARAGSQTLGHRRGSGGRPYLLDLNLQTANRLSVVLTALLLLSVLSIPFGGGPSMSMTALALAVLLAALNAPLYAFFARKRGVAFALATVPWHWLYYLYNSLSFTLGTVQYFARGARPNAGEGRLRPLGAGEPEPVRAPD